jgi:hypothetical protein
MKFTCALAVMATFALAAPAVAADKDQKSTQDAPKEKKICRTETVTGSLITKRRICMTQAEWNDLAARTKKGFDETIDQAAGGTNVQNNPGPGG